MYSKLEGSRNACTTVGHLVIRGILFAVLPRRIAVSLARARTMEVSVFPRRYVRVSRCSVNMNILTR